MIVSKFPCWFDEWDRQVSHVEIIIEAKKDPQMFWTCHWLWEVNILSASGLGWIGKNWWLVRWFWFSWEPQSMMMPIHPQIPLPIVCIELWFGTGKRLCHGILLCSLEGSGTALTRLVLHRQWLQWSQVDLSNFHICQERVLHGCTGLGGDLTSGQWWGLHSFVQLSRGLLELK